MNYELTKIQNGWVVKQDHRNTVRVTFFKTVIEATDFINTQEGMAALREAPKDFRRGGAQVDIEEVLQNGPPEP